MCGTYNHNHFSLPSMSAETNLHPLKKSYSAMNDSLISCNFWPIVIAEKSVITKLAKLASCTVHGVRAILQWKSMKGKTKMLPNKINSKLHVDNCSSTELLSTSSSYWTAESLKSGTKLFAHNVSINHVQPRVQFSRCYVLGGPLSIFHVAETVRYAPINSAPFRRCGGKTPSWAYCEDSRRG